MKIKLFVLFLILSCFLTGCGKKKELAQEVKALMEDTSGKAVKLGCYGELGDLSPISHVDSEYAAMMGYFIHAAPLRKTDKGGYVPCLFKDFSLSLDEEKHLVVEGEWHENIKWHDGSSFDASSLQFTLDKIKDKNFESPYCDVAKDVISVSNENNKCRIVCKNDSKRFLDLLSVGLLHSSASDAYKEYCVNPVGLGPYKIVSRKLGEYVILEKFKDFCDDYTEKRADKVLFKVNYNLESFLNEIRDGKYEWAGFVSLMYEQLQAMGIKDVAATCYENNACVTWLFNLSKQELKDVNIRAALSLLVDREKLTNQYGSAADKIYLSPLSENYKKAPSEADKIKAIELLKKAGIDEQHKLKLNVLVSDYSTTNKRMAEKMAESLTQYNVVLNVETVSWGEFVTKRLKNRSYDTALAILYLPKGGNWVNILGTEDIAYDSINFSGAGNKELDDSLLRLDSVTYSGNKKDDVDKVANYLNNEVPMAFLLKPYDISLRKGSAKEVFKANTLTEDVLNWPILYEYKQ